MIVGYIFVKQAGALHRPVAVRHLNHGKHYLDYSPMYLDSLSAKFIQKFGSRSYWDLVSLASTTENEEAQKVSWQT